MVDCSGLIKYYLIAKKFGESPRYSAELDMAVHINNASKKGDLSTLPEVPGTLLWMPGHVGVYIGAGQVIEARGTEYGVVQTPLKGRGWKKWFWIKEISYEEKSAPAKLTLDTAEYTFTEQGQSYTFLAKYPPAGSAGVDKRGFLFEITAKKPGKTTILATLGEWKDRLEMEVLA